MPSETPSPMTPTSLSAKSNKSDCSLLKVMLDLPKALPPPEITCKRKLKVKGRLQPKTFHCCNLLPLQPPISLALCCC